MKVMTKTGWEECFENLDIVCPFCGGEMKEELLVSGVVECAWCARKFHATRVITYTSIPLDCGDDLWNQGLHEDGLSESEEAFAEAMGYKCDKEDV